MSSPPPSSDPRHVPHAAGARDADEVQHRLEYLLDAVLSSRRTAAAAAAAIARLDLAQQDFCLHWTGVLARTNAELAFQFAAQAAGALAHLDAGAAEAWVVEAADAYDREGLTAASAVLEDAHTFSERAARASASATFEGLAPVMTHFVQGLAGRRLRVETAPRAYTDTETLYLPPRVARYGDPARNFLVYKTTVALLWAQTRFGTFSTDLHAVCAEFEDPARALQLLGELETVRLEGCIARVLPGLARDMASLREEAQPLDARCGPLLDESATVDDTIAVLRQVYANPPLLGRPWPSALEPQLAAAAREERMAREKSALQDALAQLLRDQGIAVSEPPAPVTIEIEESGEADGARAYRFEADGVPLAHTDEVTDLLDSILQDRDDLPDDYRLPIASPRTSGGAEDDVDEGALSAAFTYDEWDYLRRHYRRNWCAVRETEVAPGDPSFVAATLRKYAGQIGQLKRTFEMMRAEERVLKRQPDGDHIDFDALVEAFGDMHAGAELAPLLFTRRHKVERDLAVMFMVDMSGSTKGWINDAEREALVMLCEALDVLGDRYAIYGFSGMTRKRCEIYRIKSFEDADSAAVRARIAGIRPQDYTRMGAAIRHLTRVVSRVDARTRMLVTLSDGKPDDYSDNYRGHYGIEDTRQALIEAQRAGVKPFCITIDREARDYLPHMYGAANWTLVSDVKRLPVKVAEIYRSLTL